MTQLYITRAQLRRDAPAMALARRLVPDDPNDRTLAAHQLIWSLFADGPNRRRDFLWREEEPGKFLALSGRPPNALDDLFKLDFKEFAPSLAAGDRLGFTLRANPVISRSAGPGLRGKRHDVVMDELHAVPQAERGVARLGLVVSAGRAWFMRQGEAHGFTADAEIGVDGYEPRRIPRQGGNPIRFGQLDLTGRLTVRDPDAFLATVASGFGHARAFGCGLMLIRRA